ncbi:hypothetical protein EV385_3087 [Krasilnikovia cinnamomea]|uniref:Uncharacterized protein n=1 Tax=Krasilnikovia cinnamomea TaxID=349313 RepID=A0A4Q7ZK40_9ACTN|nr:hypothetical protein [Krasilnikovia cinnamomea]RZU51277.1 hypothetical protein EV385_3087 [Krasilnikovia cinnamomea]
MRKRIHDIIETLRVRIARLRGHRDSRDGITWRGSGHRGSRDVAAQVLRDENRRLQGIPNPRPADVTPGFVRSRC